MNLSEFKKKRVKGRQILLDRIVQVFAAQHPYAIHQFGSGATKYKDEFSDLDVWITFNDKDIDEVLSNLKKTLRKIAPTLAIHNSRSWSPVGGSANSVIFTTENGLFIADIYISKISQTLIKPDSRLLFGDNNIKRGEWRLNKDVAKKTRDNHRLKKEIDLFLNLIFISIKGIIRGWKDESFTNTLKFVHRRVRKRHKELKRRRINLSFKSNRRLLGDLLPLANTSQRKAIKKLLEFNSQVEKLYKAT